MDQLLFHPKVVHLPIALAVIMPLLAGGLALAWWRGWFPKRGWIIAILLQGLLVGSSMIAMQTGEDDEDPVEQIVSHDLIHEHEEAAEGFFWAGVGVLAVMLAAGGLRQRKAALSLAALSTAGAGVVLALGFQVGQAGGRLVYVHGAAAAHMPGGQPPAAPREAHDDGD